MNKVVCIDINSIIPLKHYGFLTGIGRSTHDLISALEGLSREEKLPFEILLYSQNMKGLRGDDFNFSFKNKHLYLRDKPKYNNFAKKIRLKELLFSYDLMHIPHNYAEVAYPQKTLITLHDALFYSYPEEQFDCSFARKNYTNLAQKVKGIVTCSESSKRDIQNYMGIEERKISVIPWGVSTNLFFPESESVVEKVKKAYGISDQFFLMTSCNDSRKNTPILMENYLYYLNKGGNSDLVLIWNKCPQSTYDTYKSEIERGKIKILEGVSDETLRALYSGALASFFPSKYEGFGMPILESFACGTPVVTCKNSSLYEVGKDTAIYVSESSKTEMAYYMDVFDKEMHKRLLLKEKALRYIQDYSWKKTAEKYIELYSKLLTSV